MNKQKHILIWRSCIGVRSVNIFIHYSAADFPRRVISYSTRTFDKLCKPAHLAFEIFPRILDDYRDISGMGQYIFENRCEIPITLLFGDNHLDYVYTYITFPKFQRFQIVIIHDFFTIITFYYILYFMCGIFGRNTSVIIDMNVFVT